MNIQLASLTTILAAMLAACQSAPMDGAAPGGLSRQDVLFELELARCTGEHDALVSETGHPGPRLRSEAECRDTLHARRR